MVNVEEVVNDPDFAQAFTINRTGGGEWIKGVFTARPVTVPSYGVISIASAQDLMQLAEGDRVTGSIVIHSTAPIYRTDAKREGLSDQIIWRGDAYRVYSVLPYVDYGYYKAFAVRIQGD